MSEGVFFGRRWDAPAFDDAVEIPTPVGRTCGYCDEAIAEGDDGTTLTFVRPEVAEDEPVHLECWLRVGLGSPAHIEHRCSCSGVPEPEDPRTWREQGREVIRLIGRGAWLDPTR